MISLPVTALPLPVLPASSVISTFILSPGFSGLVVSIANLPSPPTLPSPITLPASSLTITLASCVSELPSTLPFSGVLSAGLLISSGLTFRFSTLGAVASTSSSTLGVIDLLPALSVACASK